VSHKVPLTEVTLASETPLGARETQHTKRTTRLGTCELIVRGYVLTTRHTSRSTAPRAALRLALLHFLGRCKQRNAISESTFNRNGLSSLALRSIIHNKCPQVLEQKSLRETHMQINAREIVHIFCRYLLCGLGCLFPSWRQRSVRGTGECKNMRGYMQSNAREIVHILFRYLLCGLGCVFPRAVRGVYGGQGSAKSTGDT
jgi:hypothetical protein